MSSDESNQWSERFYIEFEEMLSVEFAFQDGSYDILGVLTYFAVFPMFSDLVVYMFVNFLFEEC